MSQHTDSELKSPKPSKTKSTSTKVVITANKEKFANLDVPEKEPDLDLPTLKKKCGPLWDQLSDDIFDLNKLGHKSAKDWKQELTRVDLDAIGDDTEGLNGAWKTLTELEKKVTIAKPYAQYHTERTTVDKNIKWLQAQQVKSADTLAGDLLEVDKTVTVSI